jgi:hypothetical protein
MRKKFKRTIYLSFSWYYIMCIPDYDNRVVYYEGEMIRYENTNS